MKLFIVVCFLLVVFSGCSYQTELKQEVSLCSISNNSYYVLTKININSRLGDFVSREFSDIDVVSCGEIETTKARQMEEALKVKWILDEKLKSFKICQEVK
jgi:hypothetical protein